MTFISETHIPTPLGQSPEVIQERRAAFAEVFGENYMDRFTDPVFFVYTHFGSYRISKFYRDNFPFMSRNFFSEAVYRRRWEFNKELITKFNETMERKMSAAMNTIANMQAEVDKLASMQATDVNALTYLNTKPHLTPIIHYHARQYLELLGNADKLLATIHALTFSGHIDPEKSQKMEQKAILLIRAIGGTLRNEWVVLMKEALRIREKQNQEGLKDEELNTAISMQTTGLEEGIKAEKLNSLIDGSKFTVEATEIPA